MRKVEVMKMPAPRRSVMAMRDAITMTSRGTVMGSRFTARRAERLSTGFVAKVKDGATVSLDLLPVLLAPGILPLVLSESGWDAGVEPKALELKGGLSGELKPNWLTGFNLGFTFLSKVAPAVD